VHHTHLDRGDLTRQGPSVFTSEGRRGTFRAGKVPRKADVHDRRPPLTHFVHDSRPVPRVERRDRRGHETVRIARRETDANGPDVEPQAGAAGQAHATPEARASKASARREGSVPPPWARSSFPPPPPPSTCEAVRT